MTPCAALFVDGSTRWRGLLRGGQTRNQEENAALQIGATLICSFSVAESCPSDPGLISAVSPDRQPIARSSPRLPSRSRSGPELHRLQLVLQTFGQELRQHFNRRVRNGQERTVFTREDVSGFTVHRDRHRFPVFDYPDAIALERKQDQSDRSRRTAAS